ncbi:hypothetical protein NQ318_021186 [Aromia moschata]|uniref:Prolyl endopeptidase n=1 Tax=Aromia moschata TaxID=1265417 RepID=A0AAV8YGW1_9CUCU|nr:hypothetical protein NQ318_021186 [Aromia moschata]
MSTLQIMNPNLYSEQIRTLQNYRIVVIDFNNPIESEWADLIPEHPKRQYQGYSRFKISKKLYDFKLMSVQFLLFPENVNIQKCSTVFVHFLHRILSIKWILKEIKLETRYSMKLKLVTLMHRIGSRWFKALFIIWLWRFQCERNPSFGVSRLIFINNFDGIFALANIRGGGEYGDKWHNGGRSYKKQNCFDDFQWAAKYLVKEKFTRAEKANNTRRIKWRPPGGLLA